jgi:hypothetical protein
MKNIIQILLSAALLAFNLPAFSQESDKNGQPSKKKKEHAHSYIEISGGISAPVGRFAQTNYSDIRSGFAAVGPIFAVSGVKYIGHSNFGLGGTFSFARYTLKNQNLATGYQASYGVDSVYEHNTDYKTIHVLVGPYYSIPLGIVTIDFHALAGVNAMWTPEIDILAYDGGVANFQGGSQYTFWQKSSFSAALAAQVGVGLRISPVKHFAIAARVDYFYSRPVFDINWAYASQVEGAFPGIRYFTSYTQPFNGINASLGLDYVFGK